MDPQGEGADVDGHRHAGEEKGCVGIGEGMTLADALRDAGTVGRASQVGSHVTLSLGDLLPILRGDA